MRLGLDWNFEDQIERVFLEKLEVRPCKEQFNYGVYVNDTSDKRPIGLGLFLERARMQKN